MVITKSLLKELFNEYNKLYFFNKLDKCDFGFMSKNNTCLGMYTPFNNLNDKIKIGTCIYWTDDLLKSVLVHEMTHMYVYRIEGIPKDGILGHGKCFRKHYKRLKKNYNLDILHFKNIKYKNKKISPKWWERLILWILDW